MITEEDLAGAELAGMAQDQRFRFIERLAASRLVSERDYEGHQIYDDYDYMSSVLEAARLFDIFDLLEWKMPSRTSDWEAPCRNFRADATRISQRILFEHFSRPAVDPNTVALDAKTKELIRFHLGQVRAVIDKEVMPDWKKQDIYDAIAALEGEIDKARTRLVAVLDVVGKALDVSEKIKGAVLKVVTIIQEAKRTEKEKSKQLAAPIEPKQIEPPKGNVLAPAKPKKNSFEKLLDDEIPF